MKNIRIVIVGPADIGDSESLGDVVKTVADDIYAGDRQGVVTQVPVDGSESRKYHWFAREAE